MLSQVTAVVTLKGLPQSHGTQDRESAELKVRLFRRHVVCKGPRTRASAHLQPSLANTCLRNTLLALAGTRSAELTLRCDRKEAGDQ
jgi:hypothetical protein